MRSKIMIKSLGLGMITIFFMMLSVAGYSQACPGNQATVTLANVSSPTSTTVEFDVYVSNSGSTPMTMAGLAGSVTHDASMLPAGATGTFTCISQPSANEFSGLNNLGTVLYQPASKRMVWTNSPIPLASTVTLPSGVSKKFARFRFTSSLPFTANQGTLTIQYASGAGVNNIIVTVYCNTNTNSTPLHVGAAGTLVVGGPYNVQFQTCATAAAQTASTGVTCFGGSNGTSTISLSPTPSVSAITYTVDGGSSQSATLSSGSFTVSGLSAGSHTIVVSNTGCSNLTATGVSVGTVSQLTNSTTIAACDNYTWSVNGQTYTTSGTYTATNSSGACPVLETLHLTINTGTTEEETQTACDSYTWSNNGTTYTESGDYPGDVTTNPETGCTVDHILHLTISRSVTYYADADGDGYGNSSSSSNACSQPSGYVTDNTDCDDSNASVHPGGTEVANGIDDDCDGTVDEGTTPTAPGVTNLTLCKGAVVTAPLSASVASYPGYTLKWYSTAIIATPLAAAPVVATTTVGVKTYWVSQKLGTGVESARTMITVTVVALPTTPVAITGTAAICRYVGTTDELTYSIADVAGATSYTWTVPAGANIVSGQGTTSLVVNYAGVAQGTTALAIAVQSVNSNGCLSVAKSLALTRVLPVAPATVVLTNPASATPATAVVAVGPFVGTTTELTLTAAISATANSYSWTLPAGVNVVSGNPATDRVLVINFADVASGTTSITASVISVSGCGNSIAKVLTMTRALPAKPGAITTTQANVCLIAGSESTVTYTVAPVVGAFANGYTWTVPTGASIVGSATGNSIVVSYSSSFNAAGSVTVTSSNGVGTSTTAATLAVAATAPAVPATLVMTNPLSATPTTAVVAAGPYMATSTVFTLKAAAVAGAVSYTWTLPAGVNQLSGGTSNEITVDFADVVTPTGITPLVISVKAVNGCGLSSATAKVLSLTRALPAKPGAIATTLANVCLIAGSESTVTYTVAPVVGAFANGYTWTVPTGASIVGSATGNSIVVSYSSSFNAAGSVTVTSSNGVGTSATAATLAVAATVPAVPATLVMTNPLSATPTTAVVAAGPYMATSTAFTLTVSPVAGAVSYTWTLPAGVNQLSGGTSNVITVDFADVVTPTGITPLVISVKAVNGCGLTSATAKVLSLTRALPVKPGTIATTQANICAIAGTSATATYSVAAVAGAFSNGYTWTVPTGASIVSGQGSTSIVVSYASDFSAGNVTVTSSNGVGTSLTAATLAVARTAAVTAPAALVGQVTGLCTGTSYSYSYAAGLNAQTYTITGPTGSIVTSVDNPDNTTNSITTSNLGFTVVYYAPLSTTTAITLVASNPCGSAAMKSFKVANTMGAITTLSGTTAVDACTTYTYTASAVVGAVSYTWTVPVNAVIESGQGTNTLVVSFPGTLPTGTGAALKVFATNACGLSSALKSITLTRIACPPAKAVMPEVVSAPFSVKAYPNPYSENFNLSLTTSGEGTVGVVVYDMTGKMIDQREVRPSDVSELQIGDRYPSGVYNVVVTQGNEVKTLRVIKR